MDNSFPQQGASDTRHRSGFQTLLLVLDHLETWLTSFFEMTLLTEEERDNAGIHVRRLSEAEQLDAGIDPDE